jgi:hypothetical protein
VTAAVLWALSNSRNTGRAEPNQSILPSRLSAFGVDHGRVQEIRLPGWTSSAEFVFAMGLIDHLVLARKAPNRMEGPVC